MDPSRCRVWSGNRRIYELLDEASCATLLDSIREHGGNFVPAIVRSVHDAPGIDFEVCAGCRRLWCVRFLVGRGHSHIHFRAIVEEGWSDIGIFRAYEAENRARADLSAYERALSYAHALKHLFRDDMRALLETTAESDRGLRKLKQLVQLPPVFVEAFGDPRVLVANHGVRLARVRERSGARAEREAVRLAAEQKERRARGEPYLPARAVMGRFERALGSQDSGREIIDPVVTARGRTLVAGHFDAATGWSLRLAPPEVGSTVDQYLDAVKQAIVSKFT